MSFASSKLIEITRAAQNGPLVDEKEFDLKIIPRKLRQIATDHEIAYNPENPVPNDPQLADQVFEAACDFLCDVGILCIDTRRLIRFDENKINEALKSAPPKVRVGIGNDSREIVQRRIEDDRRPFILGGPGGGIVSSGSYEAIYASFAIEPNVDAISGASIVEILGGSIISNSPIEMDAQRYVAMCKRNALVRVGRPGLSLLVGGDNALAAISAFDPAVGYRRTDMGVTCLVYPMKTTFNLLSKTKFYLDYGCPIYSYADQLIGGYTGGAETTAISMTAHILANLLISQSSVQEISCQDIRNNSTSGRMSIWNHSVVSQALARNTGIISFSESFAAAGPCTEMLLYESVAPALAVVSGSHAGPGPAGCGTREIDKYTGLEERFFGEVAQSLAGQKLEYVNDLAKAVLPKYEHMLTRAPHGKRFQECYNVEMTTPSSEWISILHSVKKELRQIGLELEGDADGMSTDRSNVGMN